MTAFDPKPYLIKMGTNKDGTPRLYLQTAHRVLWFRTDHPIESGWSLLTEPVQFDPYPVFKASIVNPEGVVLATGYGSAQPKPGSVYAGREIEKAETAAIGRALGIAGYGTQFDGDDESDHLADSPLERTNGHPPAPPDTVFSARAALEEFLDFWGGQSLSTADLREALLTAQAGMGHWREWTGSRADADAAVKAWLDAQVQPDADVLAAKLEAADIADTPDPFPVAVPAPLGKADAQKLTKWAFKEHGLNYKELTRALGLEPGVDVSAFAGSYQDAQDIVTAAMTAKAVQQA